MHGSCKLARRAWRVAALVAAVATLSCRGTPGPAPAQLASAHPPSRDAAFAPLPLPAVAPAHPGRSGATDSGRFVVTWRPEPDPIPLDAMFAVHAHVEEAGKPATGVDVSVDAGMPGHGHGMTVRPEMSRDAAGDTLARPLLFHMPGAWEIRVTVVRGEARDVARFAVSVP